MDLDAEPIKRTLDLMWDFNRADFVFAATVRSDDRTKRD